jgi:ADP-ribosylglycohydrolase
MIGAITGDIVGSVYEWNNIKTKTFELFDERAGFTDDSVLTVALAEAILDDQDYGQLMKEYVRLYPSPTGGYGGYFYRWANSDSSEPYNSFGNGAAMRVSPAGWAYETLQETLDAAEQYTAVTHNHPEGIKGGQATSAAIYMARTGASKAEIRSYIQETFGYDLNRTVDEIRPGYSFDASCQGTVPEAIVAFLDSTDFEDAIRNAISLGGDSDTLACITGGIAEAFYGLPAVIYRQTWERLDWRMRNVTSRFREVYKVANIVA